MTRTGTQLSAPLWRASGARCPTHRVPLACPQLAWDASHIWPGPQTIVCAGRSQEESAPFEGDCGSCWAEAGDSPHGTLNSETHPGLQVPCMEHPITPTFPTSCHGAMALGATAGPVEGAEGITSMLQEDPGTTANPGP